MNELQIFKNPEFGEIRTLEEGGKVLFCGSDVAKALGYAKPQNAIATHCKGALKRGIGVQTGVKADGSPAIQQIEMLFIPECDVYRLAAKSELPGAEKFESWVFDEVLPSIRKHGAYMTPETLEAAILNPDIMIKLCTALKDEQDKRKALELETSKQKQLIGELKPKADYVDRILQNKGLVTITQIAKDYGMSGRTLNKKLHALGVQYKQSDQWLLYNRYHGCGYTHSRTIDITRSDGSPDIKMETKWTQKGRLFLYELLKEHGILPVIERDNKKTA